MGTFELILIALVLVLLVIVGYLKIIKYYAYWKEMGVPHEPPNFLFGHTKGLGTTHNFADVCHKMYFKFKDTAPYFGFFFFIKPAAVVTDLTLIKDILIKDFNNFADRGLYYNEKHDPLSAHLFSLDGPQWRFLRNKLSPTFTSGKMKFMFPTIVKVGHQLDEVLSQMVNENEVIEIKEVLARFATDVIGTCAFGIECNSLKDPKAEFRVRGRDIFEKQNHNPVINTLVQVYPNFCKRIGVKILHQESSEFFINVVKETVKYREEQNVSRNDFMDILIALKNSESDSNALSINQLAAQAFVFYLAGFETSSTTMGFCLYELAQHEAIQEKLRCEINAVLAKHDGELTYDAMNELTYMDQVIHETLRKYPAVPVLFRKPIQDYEVSGTKFIIEKDTFVLIPVYSIHNDPDIYPNPEAFDPERFTPENIKDRPYCAYLPFGDGPRNCIGLRFGMMQTRVGLTTVIKNFKFSVAPTTQIPLVMDKKGLIYTPESGIDLKIERV